MRLPDFIKMNELLSAHCTLGIGGPAVYFSEPTSENELINSVKWAKQNAISYMVIGRGSNILFSDKGFFGLVIKLGEKFSKIEVCQKSNTIKAKAGAWMPYVARKSQANGLTGLEHTVGIPGNIGGIITMNAGSQRKSISSNLVAVKYIDENLEIKSIESKECEFGYRQSIFQRKDWIILEAIFVFNSRDKNDIRREMLSILRERRVKFPRKLQNCGSVFKSNPVMYEVFGPPGKIIESLGLKGMCFGGVCVSKKHANFFINQNNGSASEFLKLVGLVKYKAKNEYGLDLIEEVQFVEADDD